MLLMTKKDMQGCLERGCQKSKRIHTTILKGNLRHDQLILTP